MIPLSIKLTSKQLYQLLFTPQQSTIDGVLLLEGLPATRHTGVGEAITGL